MQTSMVDYDQCTHAKTVTAFIAPTTQAIHMVQAARKTQAALLALGLGALFFLVYIPLNHWSASLGAVPSLYMPWEPQIPFVADMIWPYMSLDLFFVLSFFLIRDKFALFAHSKRIAAAILISGLLFWLYPLQFGWPRPEAALQLSGNWSLAMFELLSLDLPYNQFPSLHISLSLIIWPVIRNAIQRELKGWLGKGLRALLGIWFLAIGLSTLLTYQHHLLDIVGGLLMGSWVIYLFPLKAEPRMEVSRQGKRVAARYFLAALGLSLVAIILADSALWLFYPITSLLWVAAAYWDGRNHFLHKQNGGYCWVTGLIFAPYLFGTWLTWMWYRKRLPAWSQVSDHLYIGRKLNRNETDEINKQGISAVLDLAPELSENPQLAGMNYLHIPMLDLHAPNPAQLAQALEFIQQHASEGKVYIHCALGMSRSMVVLLCHQVQQGADLQQALTQLKQAFPHSYLPEYQIKELKDGLVGIC